MAKNKVRMARQDEEEFTLGQFEQMIMDNNIAVDELKTLAEMLGYKITDEIFTAWVEAKERYNEMSMDILAAMKRGK